MDKLLLLDCDCTIRQPISNNNFIKHPQDQQIILGADTAIKYFYERDWTIVGITNQEGVAAGYKSLEDAIEEQRYTLKLLPQIKAIYFCPDFEGKICWRVSSLQGVATEITSEKNLEFYGDRIASSIGLFRKPNRGMIDVVCETMQIHKTCATTLVGGRQEGRLAALAAGIKFMTADNWLAIYSQDDDKAYEFYKDIL